MTYTGNYNMVSVKIKKDMSGLDKLEYKVTTGLDTTTRSAAESVVEDIKDNWSGIVPPRSSPGEPPAYETGELEESMKVEQSRNAKGQFQSAWSINFYSDYAAALEFGYSPRNLAPRPFIHPALNRLEDRFDDYFRSLLEFV